MWKDMGHVESEINSILSQPDNSHAGKPKAWFWKDSWPELCSQRASPVGLPFIVQGHCAPASSHRAAATLPWNTPPAPRYLCLIFLPILAHLPPAPESLLWCPSPTQFLPLHHSTAWPLTVAHSAAEAVKIVFGFPLYSKTENRIHFCSHRTLKSECGVLYMW